MTINVSKITDVNLLQVAASMTTGKDSRLSLKRAYKSMHSLCRTQLFYIELRDIPTFVVGHLVRHVHAQPFVQSRRVDRGGADFSEVCETLCTELQNHVAKMIMADDTQTIENAVSGTNEVAVKISSLPDGFDRKAPQSMSMLISAEELINISRLRLCTCASKETREVWQAVKEKVAEVDPDLAPFMVRTCVFRGGICPELKSCGYINTGAGQNELNEYKKLFK